MGLSNAVSNEIFDRIAFRYDLVNSVLSFGFHSAWRARLAKAFPPGTRCLLDLACGTAAIPLAFFRYRPDVTHITGIDISGNMLGVARVRLNKAGAKPCLIEGDALNVPFEDASFDAVTVGFALRNVPDIIRLLISAYRVLKPSGYFGILEFSRPAGAIARFLYWLYLGVIVPLAGLLFTGNWKAYRHLGESIIRFPSPDRFLKMLRQSGFREVSVRPMAFGAVTLYMAKK